MSAEWIKCDHCGRDIKGIPFGKHIDGPWFCDRRCFMGKDEFCVQRERFEMEKMAICIKLQEHIDRYTQALERLERNEQNQFNMEYLRRSREAHIQLCAQINGLQYQEEK